MGDTKHKSAWVGVKETVPAYVAQIVLSGRQLHEIQQAGGIKQVGLRKEVLLDVCEQTLGEETRDSLWAYMRRCVRFWEQAGGETRQHSEYLLVRRVLAQVRQKTNVGNKQDLEEEYKALRAIPVLGDILEEACAKNPDWDKITRLGATFKLETVKTDPETSLCLQTENLTWPSILGGAGSLGELNRTVTLTVNHAPWRDRRKRRLSEITIEVEEVWPKPAGVMS